MSKQNRTRDFEIKTKLTGTRGEEGGANGKTGQGPSRNMYKGPMDKAKGSRFEGGRRGWVGWGSKGKKTGDNCS